MNYSDGPRPLLKDVSCLKPEPKAAEVGSICKWGNSCGERLGNETELINHVVSQHINTERVKCAWKGCNLKEDTMAAVKSHLWKHYPLTTSPSKSLNEGPMLSGIPLTALLLIRNLAKFSSGALSVLEGELAVLSCEPAYSRIVSQILPAIGSYGEEEEL